MKKVGLIFGGLSNEHDVSVMSARNVEKYIDTHQYTVTYIFWGKDGIFLSSIFG